MDLKIDPAFLDTLAKGDAIPAHAIRQASGHRPGTDEYRIAQLGFRQAIERHFRGRGVVVVTRCRRHEVVVLTDAEASVCCGDRTRHALRRMGRAKKGLEGVDATKLSSEERAEHDARTQAATFMYKAARRARARAAVMDRLAGG